jgi:hypothetical protein
MKASELNGTALDWAVAKCEGAVTELVFDGITHGFRLDGTLKVLAKGWTKLSWHPSTDWSQGGPIIERENLSISYWGNKSRFGQHSKPEQWWEARHPTHRTHSRRTVGYGPTPLIAAMRCLIASKLGDKIEIPEELK